jgi:tetratricopeptide (TPR) repeat protein
VALSIITHLIHTLVDDPLYAYLGTPFLFLLPGLCLMLAGTSEIPRMRLPDLPRMRLVQIGAASVVLLAVVLVVLRRPLFGNWYAMQGATEMAKVELTDWPLNEWNSAPDLVGLSAAAEQFERALVIDPTNRTANHRLGLIAMQRQEFETAVSYLEAAYEKDPDHYGIVKSLGFSYVWQGNYEAASQLFVEIPEAQYELENYGYWWDVNGRSDLSDHAYNMYRILSETENTNATDSS